MSFPEDKQIEALVREITPKMQTLTSLLHQSGTVEFSMDVSTIGDRFTWRSPQSRVVSPTRHVLATQLSQILDAEYPQKEVLFMGMSTNKNYSIASRLADIVAEYYNQDHSFIEAKIATILQGFSQTKI